MDIALSYSEYGSGAPLILLHGNGEHSGYFDSQIEVLSRAYRVITIDTRGHGRSPRGTAPFTLEQFARDRLRQHAPHLHVGERNVGQRS